MRIYVKIVCESKLQAYVMELSKRLIKVKRRPEINGTAFFMMIYQHS